MKKELGIKTLLLVVILFNTRLLLGNDIQEFKYKGQVIHPLCFSAFMSLEGSRDRQIDNNLKALGKFFLTKKVEREVLLSRCQDKTKKFRSDADGVHIYESSSDSREMLEYQVLLKLKSNQYLVRTMWNGGGTGYFSGIMVFQLEKDKLQMVSDGRSIGGDRCNGGISIENVKKNMFVLVKNLTPPDLLELTMKGRSLKIKEYEELEASAQSCVATVKTQIYINNGDIKSKVLGFEILGPANENASWVSQYKYQKCFNSYLNEFKMKLKNKLADRKSLETFVERFSLNCLK